MSTKKISIYILVSAGSWIGGYIAIALGVGMFSGWWFLGSMVGFIGGICLFIKMGQWGQ